MTPEDFWQPFEHKIASYAELVDVMNTIMAKSDSKQAQFAWRGLVDYRWPLHSSLYRRLCWTKGKTVREGEFAQEEDRILNELRRWGLHSPPTIGRLSVLDQLAMLQHYGAPTRLVDITFNAWVGVWFAVEEKWQNGTACPDDIDARLFAIDVTDRLINEDDALRNWEDGLRAPPWRLGQTHGVAPDEWTSSVYAWKPSNVDARIFAQNGGFLLGGIPAPKAPNNTRFQFPKSPNFTDGWWGIDEGRSACCLALRPHVFKPKHGAGVKSGALYTFRISATAKKDIRMRLSEMFGYKHSTIYPDYTGFASSGTPWLKTSP